MFEKRSSYSRLEIRDQLGGGGLQDFLPHTNGRVLCACLRLDTNPDAPNVILPGTGPGIERAARMLVQQSGSIPVFLKRRKNEWEYVGDYEVTGSTQDPVTIGDQNKRAGRSDITMVIRMTRVQVLKRKMRGRAGTDWLAYWKPYQFSDTKPGDRLEHIASDQLGLVRIGDRVWVVSVLDGRLATKGYVLVTTRPISRTAAQRKLKRRDLYEAGKHLVVPANEKAVPAVEVDIHELAQRIRFESKDAPRLRFVRGRLNGGQLQRMRRLTVESAGMLMRYWQRRVKQETSQVAAIEAQLDKLNSRDTVRSVKVRAERQLRRYVFGRKTQDTCAICGAVFPVDLLVAAHIKRRSSCNKRERNDWTSNVVPMCVLGCDALFERGMIRVKGGVVRSVPHRTQTNDLKVRLKRIVGNRCVAWTPERAPYFAWHAVAGFPTS